MLYVNRLVRELRHQWNAYLLIVCLEVNSADIWHFTHSNITYARPVAFVMSDAAATTTAYKLNLKENKNMEAINSRGRVKFNVKVF